MNTTLKKIAKWGGILVIAGFVILQLVPYGRSHTNPPVQSEPNWDSQDTRALAERACFDCHSNETTWLWYSNIAPFSWLVQHDVEEGRRILNFSEWDQGGKPRELEEMAEVLQRGSMPPAVYTPLHPNAKLTPAEVDQLIAGLNATVRN